MQQNNLYFQFSEQIITYVERTVEAMDFWI